MAANVPDRDRARVSRSPALLAVAALVIYAAATLTVFHRAVLNQEVVSAAAYLLNRPMLGLQLPRELPSNPILGDSVQCFVPWMRYAADHWQRDGALPLWKSTSFCGAPLLGNGQSGLWFPLNLLALAIGAPPWTQGALAMIKLAAACWFTFLLARHMGLQFLGALLAGFVYGLGGFNTVYLLFPLTTVAFLLPLLVLVTDRAAMHPTPWRLTWVAAVCALQHLAGHPETTFHAQVMAFTLGVLRIIAMRRSDARPWRTVLARSAAVSIGFLAGAMLGAVQIVPQLEYILASESFLMRRMRQAPPIEHLGAYALFAIAAVSSMYSLRRLVTARSRALWWALASFASVLVMFEAGLRAGVREYVTVLFSSEWFGTPLGYAGRTSYVAANGAFVGAALPLALLAPCLTKPSAITRTLSILLAIGLLVGLHAPIITDLVDVLPIFRLAANERFQLFALIAAALLAGTAIDALGSSWNTGTTTRMLCAALIVITAAYGAIAHHALNGSFFHHEAITNKVLQPIAAVLDRSEITSDGGTLVVGHFASARRPVSGALLFGTEQAAPVALRAGEQAGSSTWTFSASIATGRFAPRPVRLLVIGADGTRSLSNALWPGGLLASLRTFPAFPLDAKGIWQIMLLLGTTVLTIIAARETRRAVTWLRGVLVVLVLASLVLFAGRFHPTLPQRFCYPRSPAIDFLAQNTRDARVLAPSLGLTPEVATYYGVGDVLGYDALHPTRIAALLRAALDHPRHTSNLVQLPAREDIDLRLLGLMAVRYLDRPPPTATGLKSVTLATLGPEPITLYENPFWQPRVRLVANAVHEPDDERAIARLTDPTFDWRATVIIIGGEDRAGSSANPGDARIEVEQPDRVRIVARATLRSWLVLADTFFPGWQAYVDDAEVPVLRANVAFRAVELPPGAHVVEFRYRPGSLRAGIALALAGAAVLIVMVPLARRFPFTRHAPGAPSVIES